MVNSWSTRSKGFGYTFVFSVHGWMDVYLEYIVRQPMFQLLHVGWWFTLFRAVTLALAHPPLHALTDSVYCCVH